jgi:lipoprotein-releasing system ATP-binding protein
MSEVMLRLRGIVREFRQGGIALRVLKGADITVAKGETAALVGPSGAGKSTLLHIAGLLERPDDGAVEIGGRDAGKLDDGGRTALRREFVGFVYQFHHLLPEFSALENIMLPQLTAGASPKAARARAARLLDLIGLAARAEHRPGRLSGGEQQRVAIARALANRPGLLIADEPTGNLDPATADGVFAMLTDLARREGVAAMIATHNMDLAARMDRRLELRDGLVIETPRN